MSPRGKRGELPRAVIRSGALGYFPITPSALTHVNTGIGDAVIGYQDTELTLAYRQKSTTTVTTPEGLVTSSLEHTIFNGYADALYRGRLPELMIIHLESASIDGFLDEYAAYLEKMLALGFFVSKKVLIKIDPVANLIPYCILTGDGLLFNRFMTGLAHLLKSMGRRYSGMDDATAYRIAERVTRGVPLQSETIEKVAKGAGKNATPANAVGYRIAGGTELTRRRIASILGAFGQTVTLEDRVQNPIERLEFENALMQITTVLLPAMLAGEQISKPELPEVSSQIEAGILAIGQKRHAFTAGESAVSVLKDFATLQTRWGKAKKVPVMLDLSKEAILLSDLGDYAEALALPEAQTVFSNLAERVHQLQASHAD